MSWLSVVACRSLYHSPFKLLSTPLKFNSSENWCLSFPCIGFRQGLCSLNFGTRTSEYADPRIPEWRLLPKKTSSPWGLKSSSFHQEVWGFHFLKSMENRKLVDVVCTLEYTSKKSEENGPKQEICFWKG